MGICIVDVLCHVGFLEASLFGLFFVVFYTVFPCSICTRACCVQNASVVGKGESFLCSISCVQSTLIIPLVNKVYRAASLVAQCVQPD